MATLNNCDNPIKKTTSLPPENFSGNKEKISSTDNQIQTKKIPPIIS